MPGGGVSGAALLTRVSVRCAPSSRSARSLSVCLCASVQDVVNLEKKLLSVMERILVRQKKRLWISHQLAGLESAAHAQQQQQQLMAAGSRHAHKTGGGAETGRGWIRDVVGRLFGGGGGSASTGTHATGGSARYASGTVSSLHAPSLRAELSALSVELRQLDDVRRALFLEVHDVRLGREALRSAATCQGRLFNLLGYFFSGYCVLDDHEVLTNHGWMSLDDVERLAGIDRSAADSLSAATYELPPSLLFASLNPATQQLEYRPASRLTVKPAPPSLVEMTTEEERPRWEAQDDYGMDGASEQQRDFSARSSHISLVVDPEHDMWLRNGLSKNDDGTGGYCWDVATASSSSRAASSWHKEKAGAQVSSDPRRAIKLQCLASSGVATDHTDIVELSHLALDSDAKIGAFLELYGYWLGAGSLASSGATVTLEPVNKAAVDWLLAHLQTVGIREGAGLVVSTPNAEIAVTESRWVKLFCSLYGRKHAGDGAEAVLAGDTAEIACAGSGASLLQQSESEDVQCFAPWAWRLSKEQARRVLRGLTVAAGGSADGAANLISTSSARFRDEICRLALHAGYSSHFVLGHKAGGDVRDDAHDTSDKTAARHDRWHVHYSDEADGDASAVEPVLRNASDVKLVASKAGQRVWCPTVDPHNLIVVRRVRKDARGVVTLASRPTVVGNCVYKMTMASINIVFQRVNQMDPVSRTIQIFLVYFFDLSAVRDTQHTRRNASCARHHRSSSLSAHASLCFASVCVRSFSQEVRGFVMQTASFILVGVLVATQIRGFLLQLMRFFHAWSSVLTSHSIILLLAEMMGTTRTNKGRGGGTTKGRCASALSFLCTSAFVTDCIPFGDGVRVHVPVQACTSCRPCF